MAIKLVKCAAGADQLVKYPTSSLTTTPGMILATSSNGVAEASATSTTNNIQCVSQQTLTSSSDGVLAIPILAGAQQLWEVDTTNNTAANQLMEKMIIGANAGVINNTGTDVVINTGVFTAIAISGVASDKKLIGFFNPMYQINAAS